MKTLHLILVLAFGNVIHSVIGQQVFGEIGRISTGFRYTDSEGEAIENLYSVAHEGYAVGYRHELKKKFYWSGSIIFNRYGMTGSNAIYNNRYRWDVKYLGLSPAIEYEAFIKSRFHLVTKLSADPQFMVKGTHEINNQIHNLRGVEQFERLFVFLRGGVGANYCIDNGVAISFRYTYGKGLPMGKSSDPEVLRIDSHTLSLGVLVSIGYYNYCHKKHFD